VIGRHGLGGAVERVAILAHALRLRTMSTWPRTSGHADAVIRRTGVRS
jgi:hypothetical protein